MDTEKINSINSINSISSINNNITDDEIINIVISYWSRIGKYLQTSLNHTSSYYNIITKLLDEFLISPFMIVVNTCCYIQSKPQIDINIAKQIIYNSLLIELNIIIQYEMMRFTFEDKYSLELDILTCMEIGIELSKLRIELERDDTQNSKDDMKNSKDYIINLLQHELQKYEIKFDEFLINWN